MTCDKHAWVSMKSQAGLTHLERCETCDARHISGSPMYVTAEGDVLPLPPEKK
jgi:hypothetical protein